MEKIDNEIAPKFQENDIHTIAEGGTSTESHDLCRKARHFTIHPYLQADALGICHGEGIMAIENDGNVVDHRCYMTVQGFIDILLD